MQEDVTESQGALASSTGAGDTTDAQLVRPPGGHGTSVGRPAGSLHPLPGRPPVTTPVPVPGNWPTRTLPGVQLAQRPRRTGDSFGWPANAAPGKPEGEVDTRR